MPPFDQNELLTTDEKSLSQQDAKQQQRPQHRRSLKDRIMSSLDDNAGPDAIPNVKPNSKDKLLDIQQLVDEILPHCLERPVVYNRVAAFARLLQKEVDALEKEEVGVDNYVPSRHASFLLCIANNLPESSRERQIDIALVSSLLQQQQQRQQLRPQIRIKLASIKKALELELKDLDARELKTRARERPMHQKILRGLLTMVEDRPYIYNLVVAEIHALIEQGLREDPTIIHQDDGAMMNDIPQFKKRRLCNSQARWMDVMRLDELCDMLTEGSFARETFETLKKRAKLEAIELQRKEVARMGIDCCQ